MKKIALALVAIVVSAGFVGNVAQAQVNPNPDPVCTSIVISNTGTGSNNSGVCTVITNVVVTCVNNIYVLNENDQEAVTGEAEELGNTSGSAAITGDATNENGTNVQIGADCGEATETPTTPTNPETPATPTASTPEKSQPATKVAALPYTATNPATTIAMIGAVVAAVALIATVAGLAIYRRNALK